MTTREEIFNGTVFYAYQVCTREAWFYHHNISPNKEYSYLSLGRLTHETSYQRERKEILVDNVIKIDLIKNELVAEVKKSQRHRKAARLQLAYYLFYLKYEKGVEKEGILLFPKERKTEKVTLDTELEDKIRQILQEMRSSLSTEKPPPPHRIRYCKTCSFQELCWS